MTDTPAPPEIFDTHCHLEIGEAGTEPDVTPVLARAGAAGVSTVLAVGIDLATSETVQRWSRADHATGVHVHYAAGLHPNSAERCDTELPHIAALCRDRRGRQT